MKQDATQKEVRASRSRTGRSQDDFVGSTFGDFRILKKLGEGGMGRVYLAEQISLRRKVALKVIREDLVANPTALKRFQSESKTVAQLSHANVVHVYLIGEHEGRSYMVLEYVEGKSLEEYLARQGRLDVPLTLSLLRQVGSALQRASELDVIHRDVKPANILLTRKGQAKVADFGLARCLAQDEGVDLTRDGTAVGTPLYMSPEVLEGKKADSRSDLYSLGVTFYHALTGKPPFQGSNAVEVALKHVREEPVPLEEVRPDLPQGLCEVIAKLLAKKRGERYQTAREMLDDVARVRASLGGASGFVPLAGSSTEEMPADEEMAAASKPVWKHPMFIFGLGGSGLLLVGLLVALAVLVAMQRLGPKAPPVVTQHPPAPKVETPQEREDRLRQSVERNLALAVPDPASVDECVELGVIYLEQKKVDQAEKLFERMEKHRATPAYRFIGLLGLGVTDSQQKHYRTSRTRFAALTDPKVQDDRMQIVHACLAKHPEFAKWVEQADAQNDKFGPHESSPQPKQKFRFPIRFPVKKT